MFCRVTGSYDKSLRMWSTSSWECIVIIGSAHKGMYEAASFPGFSIASGEVWGQS